MLFRRKFLDGIRSGAITLAFRRWRRPSVRTGGTLLTPIGQLSIRMVRPVSLGQISASDARRAGYESRAALLDELQRRKAGDIYRIELGELRPDPRATLRKRPVTSGSDVDGVMERLRRLDAAAKSGPWTLRTLEVLDSHPGVRAEDLCGMVGQGKERFKLNVRKLKGLGLTESLATGYRLSLRGRSLLDSFRRAHSGDAT